MANEPEDNDPLDPEPPPPEGKKAEWPRDFGSDADDEYAPSEGREGRFGAVAGMQDLLRKVVVSGLGAVFMTEEGIRATLKDMKLPKEVMGLILGQAEKSKQELMRVIGEELRRFFENPVLRQELLKLLSQVTIEVKAEVRLKTDEGKRIEPDLAVKEATVRRSKADKEPAGATSPAGTPAPATEGTNGRK